MATEIIIETTCRCGCPIRVIATEYKCHNRDWSLHTCKDLTYRDCSEYVLCRCGDESFSRCKFTGRYCDADEAGLECSMWEEEKAEILKDCEHPHLLRIGEDIGYSDVVVCQDCGAQGILRLHLITEEDVQPDISL